MKILAPNYMTGYSTYARASVGTYFDKNKVMQTAGVDVQRVNWNPETGDFEGVLVEPARTNLLLNSASLGTQTRAVAAGTTYTLTFYGTGSITLTGATGATLQGLGAYPKRTRLTFTAASSSLTLAVAGTVQYAQLEAGSYPTSYITTGGATATRAADVVGPPGMFQTSFPASPEPAYSAVTTYTTGQVVTSGVRLYESLVDGNLGNSPPDNSVKGSPTAKWLDIGPTNYFACVDQRISQASVGPGPLQTFALKLSSAANAAGFVGIQGTRIHVAFNDQAGTIVSRSTTSFWDATLLEAPSGGAIVSVCVENTGGDVHVGEFLAGVAHEIGPVQYGISVSITDYSRKDTDPDFGTTTFVERPYAARVSGQVMTKKSDFNAIYRLMTLIRAKPTIFAVSEDLGYSAATIVYGNCADFDLTIAYPTENLFNFELLSLT